MRLSFREPHCLCLAYRCGAHHGSLRGNWRSLRVNLKRALCLFVLLTPLAPFGLRAQSAASEHANVTRSTLSNGMRVVIIRNALAPVVTVEANFLVGGNETPEGFPGMAHAQEHMAFRGCTGMTADQTAAIYAQLGGQNNADTQQNITQYFATVPGGRSRRGAAGAGHLPARHRRLAGRVGPGARRHRAGGLARPLQSDLQVHQPPERGHVRRHALRA